MHIYALNHKEHKYDFMTITSKRNEGLTIPELHEAAVKDWGASCFKQMKMLPVKKTTDE